MTDELHKLLHILILEGADMAAQLLIYQIANMNDVLEELLQRPPTLHGIPT
jgi:hypothetical protein